MPGKIRGNLLPVLGMILWLCTTGSGCYSFHAHNQPPGGADIPRELVMTTMPPYTIEPPDVVTITPIKLIPKDEVLEPGVTLNMRFPADPDELEEKQLEILLKWGRVLDGTYTIAPDGSIDLGPVFGKVEKAGGLKLSAVRKNVENQLLKKIAKDILEKGKLTVELAEQRPLQEVAGEHLVRQDGTINLGLYGKLYVVGLTEEKVLERITRHLAKYFEDPQILVDISGFNSRVFYIVLGNGTGGDQVVRVPITGNERVLDALTQIGGLAGTSSRQRIHLARPAPPGGCHQVFPVDWYGITRRADTTTNYQILPGDRLFIGSAPLVTLTGYIDRVAAPFERISSTILIGQQLIFSLRTGNPFFGFGGFGGFFNPFIPTVPVTP